MIVPIKNFTLIRDFAVVQLFSTRYPATKKQTNQAGATALHIAQNKGFKRIAHLLEYGSVSDGLLDNDETLPERSKYSREELIEACQKGHATIILEFREQRYASKEEKRRLCYELIEIAKYSKQYEIADILQQHYTKDLATEIPSDAESGSVVRLNDHYKKILLGFLTGLSTIISESDVVLDPADPNTYKELFSSLASNVQKRSQELQNVNSEHDVSQLSQQDMININKKLAQISNELTKLKASQASTTKEMENIDTRLADRGKLSAIERKQLFDAQEAHKRQMVTYECSFLLYEREQEATWNRKNTIAFIKNDVNLALFYSTIENRLQALFHGVLAAQSGLLTAEKYSVYAKIWGKVDSVSSINPI
ncbi:unnamed protein product, partial [Rotaria sp. Silwood2]